MPDREVDAHGLEILTEDECYEYLSANEVGRVGLAEDRDDVVVLPVLYVIDSRTIVFRSNEGAKLHAAAQGRRVAFEVDHADEEHHTGWSVLARGEAWEVHDAAAIKEFETHQLRPWTPVPRTNWVRIRVGEISGRRFPT